GRRRRVPAQELLQRRLTVLRPRILLVAPGRIGCAGPPGVSSERPNSIPKGSLVGSVIKKRRKRMAKKKHRKLLKKTRVQRRNKEYAGSAPRGNSALSGTARVRY